jgi:chromosome segregation ATPase
VTQIWPIVASAVVTALVWLGARRKDTAEVEQIAVTTATGLVSVLRSEMDAQRLEHDRRMQELREELAAARADQAAARAEIAVLRHEVDEQRLTIANLTSQLAREQAWSTWARNDRRRMYVWLEAQGLTPPPPETPEPVWPAEQEGN